MAWNNWDARNLGGRFFPTQGDRAVVASEAGTLEWGCTLDPVQTILYVRHDDGTRSGYLHIDKSSVLPSLIGQRVTKGQFIGNIYWAYNYGGYTNACGYGDGPHLHYHFPTRPMVINGVSTESFVVNSLYTSSSSLSVLPPNRDVVRNGDMDDLGTGSQPAEWRTFNASVSRVLTSGDYKADVTFGSGPNAFYQDLNYSVAEGTLVEFVLEVNNRTSGALPLTLLMHNADQPLLNQIQCQITVPAGRGPQKYGCIGRTRAWPNLRIELKGPNANSSFRIDDLMLRRYDYLDPVLSLGQVRKIEPTSSTYFNFENNAGLQGWTLPNINSQFIPNPYYQTVINPRQFTNSFWMQIAQRDPWVESPSFFNVNGANNRYVYVKMINSHTAGAGCGQVYYKLRGDNNFIENQSAFLNPVVQLGTESIHVADMSTALDGNWGQDINQLRIDMMCDPSNSVNIGVRIDAVWLSNVPNDVYYQAKTITLNTTDTMSTVGATSHYDRYQVTTADCASEGNSVWYKYQTNQTRTVNLSTAGSNYNTVLSVYQYNGSNLTQIACNDNANTQTTTSQINQLTLNGSATPYYIRVSGRSSATGNLQLSVSEFVPTLVPTTPAPTTPAPTPTPLEATLEILRNRSFEQDEAPVDGLPDYWGIRNGSNEGRFCSTAAALTGMCAYRFEGGATDDSRLQQRIDLSQTLFLTGDTLTLRGSVWASGQPNFRIRIVVNYANGHADVTQVRVNTTSTGYVPIPEQTLRLTRNDAIQIRVMIFSRSPSGVTYFDDMSLIWTEQPPDMQVPLVPMP